MRLTAVLNALNYGRMIKFHWFIQGKKKIMRSPALEILESHNIKPVDINEVLKPPRQKEEITVVGYGCPRKLEKDKNHPDYKEQPCYIFKDDNVLLEGLKQTKVLTNTVEISQKLPDQLIDLENSLELSKEFMEEARRKVLLSCLFDATQIKLPVEYLPEKPMHRLPRKYGIDERRKCELLCRNLTALCETYSVLPNRPQIYNSWFSLPLRAHGKDMQFELSSELAITSSTPVPPFAPPSDTVDVLLPDLHPIHCTISIKKYHFYTMEDICPINIETKWPYIHTAFVHYIGQEVKNIYDYQVEEHQIMGRSLIKAFCIAGAQARAKYGNEVEELPEPMTVQVVQTDGKWFHFSVFQLNTLIVDKDSSIKNIFWHTPIMPLYDICQYVNGRPVLTQLNDSVLKKLMVFHNNR